MADQMALATSMVLNRLGSSGVLPGLVGTRFYHAMAPQGATLPAVRYQMLSWSDADVIGLQRCFGTGVCFIAASGAGRSLADIRPIFNEIDTLFGGVEVSFSGLTWVVKRQRQRIIPSVVEGKEYIELAGEYGISVGGL